MTELQTGDISWNDIELLVRRAGGYVSPSDDLRPRVLEAARLQRTEQRNQDCLRHVALFVALLAMFTTICRPEGSAASLAAIEPAAQFDLGRLEMSRAMSPPRTGDGDWRMIDAFTKMRRQQAQLLRFEI